MVVDDLNEGEKTFPIGSVDRPVMRLPLPELSGYLNLDSQESMFRLVAFEHHAKAARSRFQFLALFDQAIQEQAKTPLELGQYHENELRYQLLALSAGSATLAFDAILAGDSDNTRVASAVQWESGVMKAMVGPERVEVAVTDEFGLGPVLGIEPVEQGSFNAVFRVTLADRSVFVRINRDRNVFLHELAAYRRGAASGMPVPEIVAYLPHPASIGSPMLVLGEIEGEPLGAATLAAEVREHLFAQAGAMLRRLHEEPIDGYGALTLRDGVLRGASAGWRDYWLIDNTYDRDLEAIVRDGPCTTPEWAGVEEAIAAMIAAEVGPARLLHNDFHGAHIFTDGRTITGVIDFGNALAGDPRYDIAMSLYFCDPIEAEAFTRGYGELALDPMVDTYGIYIAAIKVHWSQRTGNASGVRQGMDILRRRLAVRSGT